MSTTIAFHTIGCRLNQAETATLSATFVERGYDVVGGGAAADVVVVNTCTVTEGGDADTRKVVNRAVRQNPDVQIALVGCQAQMQADVLATFPNVRWVVGNARKMDLASIVQTETVPDKQQIICDAIPNASFTMPVAGVDREHTRANLKIQDGCDFYCFFCVIPYARGRARSREFTDIGREAQELVTAGHAELVLTGVNIGTYAHGDYRFMNVVDSVLAVPGLKRLRISSIEPTTIPDELLTRMASEERLCRHLHIPLQSGADEILYKMNRRYDSANYDAFLSQAVAGIPDVGLGTDVIVGYPGETDALFDETVDFLRALPLSYLHVFSYSDREQAKSHKFAGHVSRATIRHRSRILRRLSTDKRTAYMTRFLGTTEMVLFERQRDGVWDGLTDTFIRVHVQSDMDLHNRLVPVQLDACNEHGMTGRLV